MTSIILSSNPRLLYIRPFNLFIISFLIMKQTSLVILVLMGAVSADRWERKLHKGEEITKKLGNPKNAVEQEDKYREELEKF